MLYRTAFPGILFISLLLACTGCAKPAKNLVNDPSFEMGTPTLSEIWTKVQYNWEAGENSVEFYVEEGGAHSGRYYATIYNKTPDHARLIQEVEVEQESLYRLSCWIKTENVGQEGKGASITIEDIDSNPPQVKGTSLEWKYMELYVHTGRDITFFTVSLNCGGYFGVNKGKASFDDAKVEKVKRAPWGATILRLDSESGSQKTRGNVWVAFFIIIISGAIAGGAGVFIVLKPVRTGLKEILAGFIQTVKKAFHSRFHFNQSTVKTKSRSLLLSGKNMMIAGAGFVITHKYFFTILVLQLLIMITLILPDVLNNQSLPADTYRDIAYIQNILNGNSIFADPAVKGEYIWYPPLEPLIMLGLSQLTGQKVQIIYNYSVLFINFLIPILFFFLVSMSFSPREGFYATILIPIMPWLNTHIFKAAMPSIHGFAYLLAGMIFFLYFEKKGFSTFRAVIMGIIMGIILMLHSLSGLIMFGVITATVFINKIIMKKPYNLIHMALLVFIPIIIWSPYLIPNLYREKLNPEPLRFISNFIYDPEYIIYFSSIHFFILFVIFAFAGISDLLRKLKQTPVLLLFSTMVITLTGQALGYLHNESNRNPNLFSWAKNVPYIIPHEFQWFFQLFLLVFIAWGFLYITSRIIKKSNSLLPFIFIIIIAFPGYIKLMENNRSSLKYKKTYKTPPYAQWIIQNTDKNAVFAVNEYHTVVFGLQPHTARKVLYSTDGYMNYNVDTRQRAEAQETLFTKADRNEIIKIAETYDVEYTLFNKMTKKTKPRMEYFKNNFPVEYEDHSYIIFRLR